MTGDIKLNGALASVAAVVLLAHLALGPVAIPFSETLRALVSGAPSDVALIVREVRVPRAVFAFGVGAALGLAGAALQGLTRNPLADAGVFGASGMAALGAVIALYFGWAAWAAPFAILGALISCVVLMALSVRGGLVALVLVGSALSSLAGALIALAMNFAPNPFTVADLTTWLLGSVEGRSWADLTVFAPLFVLGSVMILRAGPGLAALGLGEDTAQSLGVSRRITAGLSLGGAALLVGAATAYVGVVGFVGAAAAHLVRPLVGSDPARVLLPSMLLGGAITAAADLAVRLAPFDQELKLGVVAALVGAPVFALAALRLARRGDFR